MPHQPFIKTLRAQWLGQQLRHLRAQRSMTLKAVAAHLDRDLSALGRYERAEWPIGRADVVALLDLYGLHHAGQRARLLAVAEQIWHLHRWDNDHHDPVDASFINVGWLADRAEKICTHETTVIPDLLQLPAYTRLLAGAEGLSATARLDCEARQRIAEQPAILKFEAVIDEAALHRRIGEPALMRAQLEHLALLARRPNVTVRILPDRLGPHPGLGGPFRLFALPRPYPPVAHLDTPAGQLYVEAPISTRIADTYQKLRQAALDLRESVNQITSIAAKTQS